MRWNFCVGIAEIVGTAGSKIAAVPFANFSRAGRAESARGGIMQSEVGPLKRGNLLAQCGARKSDLNLKCGRRPLKGAPAPNCAENKMRAFAFFAVSFFCGGQNLHRARICR